MAQDIPERTGKADYDLTIQRWLETVAQGYPGSTEHGHEAGLAEPHTRFGRLGIELRTPERY